MPATRTALAGIAIVASGLPVGARNVGAQNVGAQSVGAQDVGAEDVGAALPVPMAPFAPGPVPAFLREHDRREAAEVGAPGLAVPNLLDPTAFSFRPPEPGRSLARAPFLSARDKSASAETEEGEPLAEDRIDGASAARPGTFSRAPLQIPSRFLKTRTVAPHTKPDVSYDVSDRTSIGMFGEMNQVARTDARAALRPERELGAGFTLQYRFDRP